jgi:hypothetical protein
LAEANGQSQVAKIYYLSGQSSTVGSAVAAYQTASGSHSYGVVVTPSSPVTAVIVLQAGSSTACVTATSLTVYPALLVSGTGATVTLPSGVSVCGTPTVSPYQTAATNTTALAQQTLTSVAAQEAAASAASNSQTDSGFSVQPDTDSSGFYYGTDSSYVAPCGSGPYNEPVGSCGNGSDGTYGEYVGQDGAWWYWKGCSRGGLADNSIDYNDVKANHVSYGRGQLPAMYWQAAGPGRDMSYNGMTGEATNWGNAQGARFVSDINGNDPGILDAWIDVETNQVGSYDDFGWNTVWDNQCSESSSYVKSNGISSSVDFADVDAIRNYIWNNSGYFPGIYSAGGGGSGSWSGIMGSNTLSDTMEWTFTNEVNENIGTTSLFPSGFSNPNESASWFASAPSNCQVMWQWGDGDGTNDGNYGDFDQIDASRDDSCQ